MYGPLSGVYTILSSSREHLEGFSGAIGALEAEDDLEDEDLQGMEQGIEEEDLQESALLEDEGQEMDLLEDEEEDEGILKHGLHFSC